MATEPSSPDNRSISELAAENRARLATDWPTEEQMGQAAAVRRRSGQLLAVYVTEPVPHYRYPIWQFKADGEPVDHFAETLQILRERGRYLGKNGQTSGWGEVEWFLSPHVLLDSQPPADLLPRDPAAVLAAARKQFIEDSDIGGF